MASALDPALAQKTLAISLTDETVPHEAVDLVSEVAGSGEQKDLALAFAKMNLTALLLKVSSSSRNDYLPSIFLSFSDNQHAKELEDLVKSDVSDDAMMKATEAAERIRSRAEIKHRELPALQQWLNTHTSVISEPINN
jgi:aminopeptidase N